MTTSPGATERLNLRQLSSRTYAAMNRLAGTAAEAAEQAGLEKPLLELVRIRASQINGCAYCLDMHAKDARHAGETEQRVYSVSAWSETPFYTERERAALELTEAITLIHDGHVPDAVYDKAAKVFGEEQLAQLIWVIIVINSYNRAAITPRLVPGGYTPGA
ncbi:carboxymuconolactone decarboxylase family protein [Kitasatospora sp. NBC_01250]|uniref:carboxymuconolactone decarboxylase family protein n=1 Tax=unclassified Kitasatospora TaxID=2633591 RepID=UPI002E132EA4|nr:MULTISPECIES: carboxymuconolactone decarboxylase family protein [unclassified Kitasatospora]WSJ66491.1 carboxymuconolactone decarboxylase family protein [Kitasatospora sp. NBC_01302]